MCIQAPGIRLWEQAWYYWAECIPCLSSWFLSSCELLCWNWCWKCYIRQNLCLFSWCSATTVSDFQQCLWCWLWWSLAWTSIPFLCGAETFVCLSQLWKCPSCGWACTQAGFHGVVHHGVQVICCMHPSLLLTDWSPTDGSTAKHWCDANSLEVKANLSAGFPGFWASTLLQFFWVTNEVSVWNHSCYFARDWVVLLPSVCAVLSFW